MVYITASGDIIQDRPGAGTGTQGNAASHRRRTGGISTLGQESVQQSNQQSQNQGGASFDSAAQLQTQGQDGALSGISRLLGVEGKRVTLPAVPWAGFMQPISIPTIHCLVIVLIFMIFGLKGGLAAIFLYGISLRQEQTQNR